MSSDVTTSACIRAIRFKVDGLDCQNEVRALKAAVGPIVGGDQGGPPRAAAFSVTLEENGRSQTR